MCGRRGGGGGGKFAFYIDKRTERQLFYMKKLMMEKCEPVHPDFLCSLKKKKKKQIHLLLEEKGQERKLIYINK